MGDMDQLRERAHLWVQANWSTEITVREWWDRLASAGLAAPTWDRHQGGLGGTNQIQILIEQALAAANAIAPPTVHPSIRLVGPALRQFATDAQARVVLPRLLCGHDLWTVMMFDHGVTDAALTAACTTVVDYSAVRINGAKPCDDNTADVALVLTRTSGEGRNGLTWMIVDLHDPALGHGERSVTFDSFRSTTDFLLGTAGDGWAVTRTILPYVERSIAGRIRRGLVHVQPGSQAGNLDRITGEVLATHRRGLPPPVERRAR